MAVRQSQWATGNISTARVWEWGDVTCTDFYFDVAASAGNGLLSADILDLGILPANAKIVDAMVWVEGTAIAANATVGILTGTPGMLTLDDGVSARVLGSEIFSAGALSNSAPLRLSAVTALSLAPAAVDRSIGLQLSANAVAQASKIHVRVFYVAS